MNKGQGNRGDIVISGRYYHTQQRVAAGERVDDSSKHDIFGRICREFIQSDDATNLGPFMNRLRQIPNREHAISAVTHGTKGQR